MFKNKSLSAFIPGPALRRALTLACTALLAAVLFAACGEGDAPTQRSNAPDVPQASVAGSVQEGGRIVVTVQVPPGHHAYLDKGDDGFLIPVTFDWQDKPEPETQMQPEGQRSEEFQATVLRGQGTWVFAADNPEAFEGETLRVRSQVCEETKGVCYRPVWTEVKL